MAVSRKVERELIRNKYLEVITDALLALDEDVLRVKSNEIAIPVVGCEGNEDFLVVTVKVPTGANKGTEPYDGYEMAKDYERGLEAKEEKERQRKPKRQGRLLKTKRLEKRKENDTKRTPQGVLFNCFT